MYLLLESSSFCVFCHYIVQCLDTNVDDATELVLDHTDDEEKIQSVPVFVQDLQVINSINDNSEYNNQHLSCKLKTIIYIATIP